MSSPRRILELHEARFQLRLFSSGIADNGRDLHCVLFGAHHASFLAQRAKFRSISRSEPNRRSLRAHCDRDSCLRSGRCTQKKTVDRDPRAAPILAAIILNFSRAGVGILVAGSAFWLSAFAVRQRSPSRFTLAVSFLLLLLTALLLLDGQTFERFRLHDFGSASVSTDFRWQIFHDTFRLIRNSPWCGIGLGNFESIFAIFRDASFSGPRALHPESDWLWLWTELGWPAVVLTIVGIALLGGQVFPLRVGTNQGYRLAALIAALLFALHGIIDVSAHWVGRAFAAVLFLLGIDGRREKKEIVAAAIRENQSERSRAGPQGRLQRRPRW